MALFIPPGNGQLIINISRDGDPDPYAVTVGLAFEGDPFQVVTKTQITAAVQQLLPLLGPNEQIDGWTLRYNVSGGDLNVMENTMNEPGTSSDSARTPQNVAVLVRKETDLAGRRNRGRLFWPSVARGNVNSVGQLSDTTVEGYQDTFDQFYVTMFTNGEATGLSDFTILHTVSPGGDLPPTPIARFSVEPVVASQRRRLRR